MSSTSNASLSGSSAATNTVVVTARDIEFSNYDSSTGKWGSAVMTMMILDSVTEGLEEYDERVYAVFRNHDDPTDLIEFSSEVDGLDTRVTTTDPMVPSAKYELYKVYGAISGEEYATTSQFYFQVPGKAWDFANDTVGTDDITLVSDWNNYGEIVTATKTYKIADAADLPAMNGKYNFSQNYNWDFTVNGETVNSADVTGIRLTSLVDEAVFPYSRRVDLTRRMDNLEDVDIVSSRITTLYGPCVQKPVHRFAIPETVTNLSNFLRGGNIINTKTDLRTFPMYIPDSVTRLSSFMYGVWEPNKLRMSPNVTNISDGYYREAILAKTHYELPDNATWASGMYIFDSVSQANGDEVSFDLDKNVTSSGNSSYRILGQCYSLKLTGDIVLPGGFGKLNSTISSTNTATSLNKIEFKEGITVLENGVCNMVGYYGSGLGTAQNHTVIKLPNSLTKVSNSCFFYMYKTSYVDFEFGTGLTTMGSDNFAYCRLYGNQIKIPGTVTSIGNGFFHDTYSPNGLDLSELSSPNVVSQQNSFSNSSTRIINGEGWLEVTVEPGTIDAWEARFPNYYNSSFDWRRVIWKERPTQYGYVFYVESNGGQEKYVELQSQAEFESFVNPAYNSGWSTTVGEEQITLYASDTVYPKITGVTIGTDITSIPNKFMYGATALTRAMGGDAVTSIGNYFCASTKINNAISFPLATTVGANFLSGCHVFNKTVSLPNATVIGASFLEGDKVYNQPFTFPSGITVVPKSFMKYCVQFDQPLSIPNGVTTIGEWFLAGQSDAASNMYFNSAITIPSTVRSIGQCFMYYCVKFNQPLTIPASSIGQAFMYHCTDFNQPITLTASSISSLAGFMGGCTSFNQPLDLSMVTSLERSSQTAGGLLASASSFNSDITFKQQMYKFEYMFDGWTSFNRPVTLPAKVTGSFNGTLFNNCPIFDQDIVMPENTTSYNNYAYLYIFKNCKNMKSTVTFNNNTFPPSGKFVSDSFTTTDATADCYTSGINITGASATTLKNLLPDSDSSPYRKINLI